MKIVVVALIGQLGRGGSERQLYLTMRYLNPNKFEKHIIVFNPSPHAVYDSALKECGVFVWNLPDITNTKCKRIIYIYKKLKELRADIVHSWTVHDNPYAAICGFMAATRFRWGSVRLSLRTKDFQGISFPYRFLSLHSPSHLIVNSNELVQELRERHVSPKRILYLPNAVEIKPETERFISELTEFNIKADDIVIGTIGNLRYRKNQLMFIRALAPLVKRFDRLKAVIVGQEIPTELKMADKIKREIFKLNLSKQIFLTGFRDDVRAILNRLTIFCLTSRHEGTPNVLLEAMAAGKPVIATAVGGVPDVIIHEQNGLLINSEDVSGLSDAIERLILDRELSYQLGKSARAAVEVKYDASDIAEKLERLYLKALKE